MVLPLLLLPLLMQFWQVRQQAISDAAAKLNPAHGISTVKLCTSAIFTHSSVSIHHWLVSVLPSGLTYFQVSSGLVVVIAGLNAVLLLCLCHHVTVQHHVTSWLVLLIWWLFSTQCSCGLISHA